MTDPLFYSVAKDDLLKDVFKNALQFVHEEVPPIDFFQIYLQKKKLQVQLEDGVDMPFDVGDCKPSSLGQRKDGPEKQSQSIGQMVMEAVGSGQVRPATKQSLASGGTKGKSVTKLPADNPYSLRLGNLMLKDAFNLEI